MNRDLMLRPVIMVLALWPLAAVGQSSFPEIQSQAEEVLRDGDADSAISLTASIIAQDPNFSPAHFVQAIALEKQGRYVDAAKAAARAYDTAQNDTQRLQAARLASRTRAAARQYSRAELWLRRAANNASKDEDRAQIQADFNAVRRANPLTVWLNFGATPSNNINNGRRGDEVFWRDQSGELQCFLIPANDGPQELCPIQTLGASGRVLSGIEYFGSADLEYRLLESNQYLTTFDALVFARTYTLSSESRDLVEELGGGVDGGDFSLAVFETGITHRMRTADDGGSITLSAHTGKVWSGWKPFWYYDRFAVDRSFRIDDRRDFAINASVEFRNPIDESQLPTRIDVITARHTWRRPNDDVVQFSIRNQDLDTGTNQLNYEDHSIALNYAIAEELWGTKLSFNTRLGQTHYEDFQFTVTGRLDHYATIGIDAVFNQVSYFGFSPSMTLSATRRVSDLPEYTTTTWNGGLGIQSNF